MPALNLRKKFVYFTSCSLANNVQAFLQSMGLEVVGSAQLTYFLDGKLDLGTVPNAVKLIGEGSMLHLVNIAS